MLCLDRCSMALNCFKTAMLDNQTSGNCEMLVGFVEKCKKFEFLSRSGTMDLSDWVSW